jgi:hypothetical protein
MPARTACTPHQLLLEHQPLRLWQPLLAQQHRRVGGSTLPGRLVVLRKAGVGTAGWLAEGDQRHHAVGRGRPLQAECGRGIEEAVGKRPGMAPARNEHWISEAHRAAKSRRRRERQKEPLILCGHGVSLRVDGGTLLIRNGLTHYPQKREELRFFKGDLAIPPRIIMLDGSGCISFDVLDWLAEQRVALVRINWRGEVVTVLASSGKSSPGPIRHGASSSRRS